MQWDCSTSFTSITYGSLLGQKGQSISADLDQIVPKEQFDQAYKCTVFVFFYEICKMTFSYCFRLILYMQQDMALLKI